MPPLTPAVLHILLVLASGELHGYAIAQEVEHATDGAIRMGPGTLYGSIERMLDAGLITEAARSTHRDDDPRRRYYRIAAPGKRALSAELARLERVVAIARAKHLLGSRA